MDKWTELRTAYKLAKLGTLSATAEAIGVHRSTVMRHINVLEESLGVVLFQRNDKGYIPTDAGLDVMRLGEVTDTHFSQLPARLQSKEQTLQGTLTITMISEAAGLLMPAIKLYQAKHPEMRLNIIGDLRNFDLEYGEADIAIRAGTKPTTPDNVVLPMYSTEIKFCAHQRYVETFGMPNKRNLKKHRFLALNERLQHLPWNEWIYTNIPENNIMLRASSQQILTQALATGTGIGAMPQALLDGRNDWLEIPSPEQWEIAFWILVHRDMFQVAKIREFLEILQQQKRWSLALVG